MAAAGSKIVTSLLLNLALFLPCLPSAVSSNQSFHPSTSKVPLRDDHTRFSDVVERHCHSVLSSATELRYDPDEAGVLKFNLSFMNGDWTQDAGQAPLLPSHGSYADAAAVPLASFMLTGVDMAPRRGARARTAFDVSGILSLTITRNCCCTYMSEPRPSQYFELWPGVARLLVLFRGVYTETKPSESGSGERVLCMVGNAALPVPCSNSTEQAGNHGGDSSNFKPPVVADGNILLVLRYPKTLALTTRAVRGEMASTSARSDRAYFDTVCLVSQAAAGQVSGYQFRQEEAELDVVNGCSDAPLSNEGSQVEHLNSGAALCQIINQYSPPYKQVMEVIPNLDCDGTDKFCSRVGPFETSRSMEDTAFTRSLIVVQGLKCQATVAADGTAAARVAAVFRFVPPWEDQPTAANRTGLNAMTLSAEGVWAASMGRVCMVGCLGVGDEACRHRVTLFVRTTFTTTRRSDLVGQITSLDGRHAPLLFQRRVNPRPESFPETPHMSYMYTKVEQASELLRRGVRAGFRDGFVARSLLGYPNIAGDEDDLVSVSNLADNLSLRFVQRGVKLPFAPEWIEEPCFELQILSVGTLVGRYPAQSQGGSSTWIELLRRVRFRAVENQQILNVSAELTASRDFLSPIPVMSLEGVYSPADGRMYLIGCRNIHTSWRVLSKRRDLEDGMDCSVEVMVEYPPTMTTRWPMMMSQTAKMSVGSRREEDDSLHFDTTELRTLPVVYRDHQRWDELIKPIAEGLLCITVLTVVRTILVPVAFLQLLGY